MGIPHHDQLCWGEGVWVLHVMISCAGVTWSVGITHHDQLCWGDGVWVFHIMISCAGVRECGYYIS